MAKIIDLDKNKRATSEQQALRRLQQKGGQVTQENIYQEAYGTKYPVFSDKVNEAKKKTDQYAKNAFDFSGNIRKGIVNPKSEEKYKSAIETTFSDLDPLTRKRIENAVLNRRNTAMDNAFQLESSRYISDRDRALTDLNYALRLQDNEFQTATNAEEQARKEAEAAARKGRGGRRSGNNKSSSGKVTFDEYLNAAAQDPTLLSNVIQIPPRLLEEATQSGDQSIINNYVAQQGDLLINQAQVGDANANLQLEAAYNDFIKYRSNNFTTKEEAADDFTTDDYLNA